MCDFWHFSQSFDTLGLAWAVVKSWNEQPFQTKKQILTTAIVIICSGQCCACAIACLVCCITCSTLATIGIRTFKCCWRRRKTISSKSNLYRNMEGIASICFQPQLCWILQTTDLWVSKDSESCGKSVSTHL